MYHMLFFRKQRRWLAALSLLTLGTTASLRAAEDATGYLLVANKGDQTLAIVDPVAGLSVATSRPRSPRLSKECRRPSRRLRLSRPTRADLGAEA